MTFIKPVASVCMILFVCHLIYSQQKACGYGYAREEDPLIKAFKAIIFHGREGNWPAVIKEINRIDDRIDDINKIFGIDFKPWIDKAIQRHDFQSLANKMANLVFFAIREKFYYNLQEGLKIFIRARVRLRLAEEYYLTLLAGNVREYDLRHNTNLHEEIYNRFIQARKSLGSRGFFGAGAEKPDVKEFEKLTTEIVSLLLKAFPYFER